MFADFMSMLENQHLLKMHEVGSYVRSKRCSGGPGKTKFSVMIGWKKIALL